MAGRPRFVNISTMRNALPTLRPMHSGDLKQVAAVERSCFDDPWPMTAFREMLSSPRSYLLAAVDPSDTVIGYLCSICLADELQIQNIAVMAGYRRQGFGRLLMAAAEEEGIRRGAVSAVLEVRDRNKAALALYTAIGYRQIGHRRGYYDDPPADALVLAKALAPVTDGPDGMVS